MILYDRFENGFCFVLLVNCRFINMYLRSVALLEMASSALHPG